MKGTEYCIYETPCGWCTKFNDECTNIHKRTQEGPGTINKDTTATTAITNTVRKEYHDLY